MELRELITIIQQYRMLFAVVLVLVIAFVVWDGTISRYDTSVTILVHREGVQQTEEYKYGGYYELQSSEQFSKTIEGLFLSPGLVRQIFESAKVQMNGMSLRSISSFFDSKAVSAQHVEVRYTMNTKKDAMSIAEGLRGVLEEQVQHFNDLQYDDQMYAVRVSEPVVMVRSPYYALRVVCAAFAGVVFAVVVVSIVYYIRTYYKEDIVKHEV